MSHEKGAIGERKPPHCDPAIPEDARRAAEGLLLEFQSGDRWLGEDNAEIGYDTEAVRYSSEQELLDATSTWGEDAFDTLKASHPSWSERRIREIISGGADLSKKEIDEHAQLLIEQDDLLMFIIYIGIFPVPEDNPSAWAVIRESGIAGDRDYEIDGIFVSKKEASSHIEKFYYF